MKDPAFWRERDARLAAAALSPAAWIVSAIAARRAGRPGDAVGVPVLCCGNATVGGAGKTTVALDLLGRLAARGLAPHALTRGHGGRAHHDARRVDQPSAERFGDEALLLARTAPTWVGADRAASARAAVAAGARSLVMDDGLQRCRAVILVGEDRTDAVRTLRGIRPILRARLRQGREVERLRGRPVVAFAGIARPAKFFDGLAEAGVSLAARIAFADHHRFRPHDLRRLLAVRAMIGDGAVLATTAKDAVRLPSEFRREVVEVSVSLEWHDDRLDRILDAILPGDASP